MAAVSLILVSCTNSTVNKSASTTSLTFQTQSISSQTTAQTSEKAVSPTSNVFTNSVMQQTEWAIIGIIGGILFLLWQQKSKRSHHVDLKDWRILGIPMVLLAIYGIGSQNQEFGAGLTLLATLVVAFMTLMSFQQTANLELNRSRDAMLNEIRDWTINILKCGVNAKNLELIVSGTPSSVVDSLSSADLVFNLFALSKQGFYMSQIAGVLGVNLEKAVQSLQSQLEEHVKLIKNEPHAADKIGDHRIELDKLANNVITEITSLKAEGLPAKSQK
jgi:uncharacterized lipoprotein NlpE involved in copper resistance